MTSPCNIYLSYRGQANILTTTPQRLTYAKPGAHIISAGSPPIGTGTQFWNSDTSEFTVPKAGPYSVNLIFEAVSANNLIATNFII